MMLKSRAKKALIKELNAISKVYGVDCIISVEKYLDSSAGGGADMATGRILIASNIGNREDFIRIFFHELGHFVARKKGKYVNYHNKDFNNLTDKDKALIRKIGLNAEKWVDDWAARSLAAHFPEIQYDFPYSNPEGIKWYKEWLKEL